MINPNTLFNKNIAILKGLAHPVRFSIVQALSAGEMSVHRIAELFSCDRTTISKHLAFMKKLGILSSRKDGLKVYYSLRVHCLPNILSCIQKIAEGKNPEIFLESNKCNKE